MGTEFVLTPVTGRQFVGRHWLVKELATELKNPKSNVGFCLYGKRRVGKTSILMEIKHLLAGEKGTVVAYLSLYDLADLSLKTFTKELANAVLAAYQEKNLLPIKVKAKKLFEAPIELVTELLKSAKVEAQLVEQVKILLEYREKENISSEHIRHAFNIGESLAKATSTKCVLILDEFPEILKMQNGMQLVKILRTQSETQKRTSLVISGSVRKTLAAVALSGSSPFYKQLIPKHVQPFTIEETREFLKTYANKFNKTETDKMHELTGGLPFYLQYIGRATQYTAGVDEVVSRFIEQEGNLYFKEEFEHLTEKEKGIVLALSKGKRNLAEIARGAKEPITTIGRYLPVLLEEDVVQRESRGVYRLSDNLFSYWLKKKYIDN